MNQSLLVEELNTLFKEPKKEKVPETKKEGNFSKLLTAIRSKFGKEAIVGEPKDNGTILILHLNKESYQSNQAAFELSERQDWIYDNGCHLVSALYNHDPDTVKLCFCVSHVLKPSDTKIPSGGESGPDASKLQQMAV